MAEDAAGEPARGTRDRARGARAWAAKCTVMLVEPRSLMREGLARWIRTAIRNAQICVSDGLSNANNPDVDLIVFSVGAAQLSASSEPLCTLRSMVHRSASKPLVILSDVDDFETAVTAIRNGARGYIPTTLGMEVATAALKLVIAGGTFISAASLLNNSTGRESAINAPETAAAVKRDLGTGLGEAPASTDETAAAIASETSLTPREREVLACLSAGKQNKLIAYELNMRESTVKVHVRHLMKKFNATNRTQLAVHGTMKRGPEPMVSGQIVGARLERMVRPPSGND
jgi:DNA-binding NarL/FixJ family response regulator